MVTGFNTHYPFQTNLPLIYFLCQRSSHVKATLQSILTYCRQQAQIDPISLGFQAIEHFVGASQTIKSIFQQSICTMVPINDKISAETAPPPPTKKKKNHNKTNPQFKANPPGTDQNLIKLTTKDHATGKKKKDNPQNSRKRIKNKKKKKGGWLFRQSILTEEGQDGDPQNETGRRSEGLIDGCVEDGEGGDEGREKDLSGEDAVDLADESPPESILSVAEAWIEEGIPPLFQVQAPTFAAHPCEFVHLLLLFFSSSSPPSSSSQVLRER